MHGGRHRAMRTLTNECPSPPHPPPAPTRSETVQARREAAGRLRSAGRAVLRESPRGRSLADRGFSGLFLVVRPLPWCFRGCFQGQALPFPAQWSFSSFVRFSLGTPPPSLAFLCSSRSGGVTDCFGFGSW